jgi:hypothetical protein
VRQGVEIELLARRGGSVGALGDWGEIDGQWTNPCSKKERVREKIVLKKEKEREERGGNLQQLKEILHLRSRSRSF